MASMVVLYFVAILYSESPLCTVYVIFVGSWDGSSISAGFGNFNIWPIDKIFDVKLFNFFRISTVVLNSCAILYKLSPFFTVYVSGSLIGEGIFNNCPTLNVFYERLFKFFNSSTVTL